MKNIVNDDDRMKIKNANILASQSLELALAALGVLIRLEVVPLDLLESAVAGSAPEFWVGRYFPGAGLHAVAALGAVAPVAPTAETAVHHRAAGYLVARLHLHHVAGLAHLPPVLRSRLDQPHARLLAPVAG